MIELIKNNLVLIVVVTFFVLKGVGGYQKGFVKMLASFAGMIASLFISQALAPKLAERMANNNSWVTFVQTEVLPKLKVVTMEQVFLAVSFLVLFIVTSILVRVLAGALERMMEGPVMGVINQIFGILFGLAEALVYTWAAMLFIDIMPQITICQTIQAQIYADELLTIIHENNLLITYLQNVLQQRSI